MMIDESIVQRLIISLGSMVNVVSVGVGAYDTIVVSVNENYTGTIPTTFEGYQVIKQVVPLKD